MSYYNYQYILLLLFLVEPRRISGCHLACNGIRWFQRWPRDVDIYQALSVWGIVCGYLGD